jgi:hypothetical protein
LSAGVEQGDFVEVRGRQWLVEAINDAQPEPQRVHDRLAGDVVIFR